MIPFNYHHLYYFYNVAKEGAVSRAAKKLRLAQPTLSAQLKQFETWLERKLFLREGRKLLLTEDGFKVLSYAETIFDAGKEMLDHLNDSPSEGKGRLQIGVSGFIPKTIVDALVRFVLDKARGTFLTVTEKDPAAMKEDLETHKLDLIINDLPFRGSREEGLENFLLAKIPVVFCSSRSLAPRFRSIPASFNGAPMILPTAQSQTYHALQEFFLARKITPNIIAEIQDVEVARRLALSGKGIVPLNRITAAQAPAKEKLVILGPSLRLPIFENLYLTRKKRRQPHPVAAKIIDEFRIQ